MGCLYAEDHPTAFFSELCEVCPASELMCFLQSLNVPPGKMEESEESFLVIHKHPAQGLFVGVVTFPEFLTVINGSF